MNFRYVKQGFAKCRTIKEAENYKKRIINSDLFNLKQLRIVEQMFELRKFELKHPQIEREINATGVSRNERYHR